MDTEDVSARFRGLDTWSTGEVVTAILDDQLAAAAIARAAAQALMAAADAAVARLTNERGRLVYAGAGASGRLAVQDGIELYPTYGWPDHRLGYLMAGGDAALAGSVEGAEDDTDGARARVADLALGPADVLVAVTASGKTPWTVAAAEAAHAAGALVIGIANNPGSPLTRAADHPVVLATGAEVVAGSTRMAAGTAQKIALTVLSTTMMVRLNRTYGNLMVGLSAANAKLEGRRVEILRRIQPATAAAATEALAAASQDIRTAALVLNGRSADEASELLAGSGGSLRAALDRLKTENTEAREGS